MGLSLPDCHGQNNLACELRHNRSSYGPQTAVITITWFVIKVTNGVCMVIKLTWLPGCIGYDRA